MPREQTPVPDHSVLDCRGVCALHGGEWGATWNGREQTCRNCACAITIDATGQYVHLLTGDTACDLQAEPIEDDRG